MNKTNLFWENCQLKIHFSDPICIFMQINKYFQIHIQFLKTRHWNGMNCDYIYFFVYRSWNWAQSTLVAKTCNMHKITTRMLIVWENYDEFSVARIDNPTAKLLKLHARVVNSIHFMSAECENRNWNAHSFFKKTSLMTVF